MLLLTRRQEESILIGNDVEVKVLSIAHGQVTLGITAPSHVPVHRREIHEAIRALNRTAATAHPADLDKAAQPLPPSVGTAAPKTK